MTTMRIIIGVIFIWGIVLTIVANQRYKQALQQWERGNRR